MSRMNVLQGIGVRAIVLIIAGVMLVMGLISLAMKIAGAIIFLVVAAILVGAAFLFVKQKRRVD